MAFSLIHRDPFFPFHRSLAGRPAQPGAQFVPSIDAVEDEAEFRVTAELPGLDKDDFSVELEDGVLTLKGEKRSHYDSADDESPRGVRRVEARYGSFERRLRFGVEVDEDGVSASYKNGVLEIVVPKRVEDEPPVRTIEVETA